MGGCLSSPYAAKAGAGAPDGGAVPNSRFEQAKATRRPSEKRRNRLESQLIEAVKDHCANPTVKLKTMNSILMKVRTYARLAALVLRLLKGTADGTGGTGGTGCSQRGQRGQGRRRRREAAGGAQRRGRRRRRRGLRRGGGRAKAGWRTSPFERLLLHLLFGATSAVPPRGAMRGVVGWIAARGRERGVPDVPRGRRGHSGRSVAYRRGSTARHAARCLQRRGAKGCAAA